MTQITVWTVNVYFGGIATLFVGYRCYEFEDKATAKIFQERIRKKFGMFIRFTFIDKRVDEVYLTEEQEAELAKRIEEYWN